MASICISGSIGCGKSTLVENLLKSYGAENLIICPEPVSQWLCLPNGVDKKCDINMLDMLYHDMEHNFFPFQTYVFTTLAEKATFYNQEKLLRGKVLFAERSLHDAWHIFSQIGFETGCLDDVQYSVLLAQYKMLVQMDPDAYEYDLTIYLKVDAETSIERVKMRARAEERTSDPLYLDALVQKYDDFYSKGCKTYDTYPNVVIIDANNPIDIVQDHVKYHISKYM